MPNAQSLPWVNPLDAAAAIDEAYWVLLYSGAPSSDSGRYSYLACDLAERVEGSSFDALAGKLSHNKDVFDNSWFGYLGYGLKDSVETLPPDEPNWLTIPDLCMMRFKRIYRFDHKQRSLTLFSESAATPLATKPASGKAIPEITSICSNMRTAEYLEKAAQVIEHIRAGDLYQANLTRKFIGSFSEAPDAFELFRTITQVSPATYSAYVRIGDVSLLSSSPELFLRIGSDGRIITRPIKGTAARSNDPKEDERLKEQLANSTKDKAENLMIVDLMRNDFSRSCVPGSIAVGNLFEVTAHATIHHMASTVSGQKRPDVSTLDAIKHCFPPGSMTGAPKIKAMKLCSTLEQQSRGAYSGAIGWLGGDGSGELSVVIRTLALKGRDFEFQVGGGIVADSTPESEYLETLDKAKGLCRALGLPLTKLANL